jgi:predicted aminopeptidase
LRATFRSRARRPLRTALAVAVACALSGCATVSYYYQAVRGQFEILAKRRPIVEAARDPAVPESVRERLVAVLSMREFAVRELRLPDNGSYRGYSDLGRPYALWNVFAAGEFSTALERWCFPVAGCIDYRGYFDQRAARAYADGLAGRGYDVYVGGVPAYSTLGWFDDPVLSTFIRYPEAELARLLFHELAHQIVYVQDDSTFNESFATAVEEEGMERWIALDPTRARSADWEAAQRRRRDFLDLVLSFRGKLDALYRSDLPDDRKRLEKRDILAALGGEYQKLKQAWGGYPGYDRWFSERPNNAQLASVAIYTRRVPAFREMLRGQRGDFGRFYRAVKALARLPRARRDAILDAAGERRASADRTGSAAPGRLSWTRSTGEETHR